MIFNETLETNNHCSHQIAVSFYRICQSRVGYQGGMQIIDLGVGCLTEGVGKAEHEVLHALGLFHEQSRPDRDEHVTIIWGNIRNDMLMNFVTQNNIDLSDMPYDIESVMHYGAYDFAKNRDGGPTIIPSEKYKQKHKRMGQRAGLSDGDVYKLRTLYMCSNDDNQAPTVQVEACAKLEKAKAGKLSVSRKLWHGALRMKWAANWHWFRHSMTFRVALCSANSWFQILWPSEIDSLHKWFRNFGKKTQTNHVQNRFK